jgi:hypothetical protein
MAVHTLSRVLGFRVAVREPPVDGDLAQPLHGAFAEVQVAYCSRTGGTIVNQYIAGIRTLAVLVSILGCRSSTPAAPADSGSGGVIELNLRVHVMQSEPWIHSTGTALTTWVTTKNVTDTILPEMNSIWSQADIRWVVESILLEDIDKPPGYQDDINYVLMAQRNAQGQADPERLPHLYRLMQPQHRSTEAELTQNLFHVYLFPFTGNTSQGNAMADFGYHVVTGIWTNKFNDGGVPERHALTESHARFQRGSISQTLAHELGHVLGLTHQDCTGCLMSSDGYDITQAEIDTARALATERLM